MSLLLPIDDNGHPLSVLGFDYRGTQKIAVGTTSARNPSPVAADVQLVTLLATAPCHFEIGDASVTADPAASPYLAAGQYVDVPLRPGERYVALVAAEAPCTVYLMGRI